VTRSASRPVRLYLASLRLWRRGRRFSQACFNGFWLGALRREELHLLDELYYDGDARVRGGNDHDYGNDEYNQRGLSSWEREIISRFFPPAGRLLLVGAGGGREVVALQRLGYQVDAFECHPQLVKSANELLGRLALTPSVHLAPRDACPDDPRFYRAETYHGLIVGWSAYMLIRGRGRRVALLKQLRARAGEGAPVLISFIPRQGTPRWMRITAWVGNLVARLRFGDPVEVGDDLVMNFVHRFTREEIESELHEAGFDLIHFGNIEYGHALGVARTDGEDEYRSAGSSLPAARAAQG
jgi:hypothetical protein